jgi:hypothetical protein
MKIMVNQVRCLRCGDEPFSRSVHNYKSCKCGTVSVDGGMQYLKRCGELNQMEDISITVTDKVFDELMRCMSDKGKNDLGKLCSVVRVLRDNELFIDKYKR